MEKLSLPKSRIKILLLENIHKSAVDLLKRNGYANIESIPGALEPEDLKARLKNVHILGIRSRTRLTKDILSAGEKLLTVGCFCIGTNQVDLRCAKRMGVPVFNAPYSNTRSVAELVIAEIIMLFRGIPQRSWGAHEGAWDKTVKGAKEIRGKTLGIVGYGHIGSQLSVMAEAMGMQVRFHDIVEKLAIGNAKPCVSLDELLAVSDVVTLHVPETPQTKNMITAAKLKKMNKGSFLINASRGTVVEIDSLADALKSGHIAGAAVDVFPKEPADGNEKFKSPLQGLRNVILTPHIGGSTEEAQANIGGEVAEKLVKYSDNGSTLGAVNFVEVALPIQENTTRFMHIHRDVPGVMSKISEVFARRKINIAGQYLRTDGEIGYVVTDVTGRVQVGMGIRKELAAIDGTVRTRFLYEAPAT
ncbi:MAG: phosphoglycerate dehydrogenase [Rhodospirillaceae bacterium]|nr:MAG: phosphoglycerate dehydrogenase [Rhodospirillaceae bacterium]